MILSSDIKGKLDIIVELLYQQNKKEAYTMLVQILPDLEAYINTLEQERQSHCLEDLGAALQAMEQQDDTLMADVLQYELMEHMGLE